MRSLLYFVFVLVWLIGAGCNSASDTATKESAGEGASEAEYEFIMNVEDVAGRFSIVANGFPIRESRVTSRMAQDRLRPRMNTALIGKGNTAGVKMEPYIRRSGEQLNFGPVRFSAHVRGPDGEIVPGTEITAAQVDSAYAAWKPQIERQWRTYLEREGQGGEAWAHDSLEAWFREHPMEVTTGAFDNASGPDFSSIFGEEAPRIEGTAADSARLTDYAIRLRDLLKEGNAEALYQEIRPAVEAAAVKAGEQPEPASTGIADWRSDARRGEGWFEGADEKTNFSHAQVDLRQWAGGRVWELHRHPDEPLLGGWKVYVAGIAGELKVVRLE